MFATILEDTPDVFGRAATRLASRFVEADEVVAHSGFGGIVTLGKSG